MLKLKNWSKMGTIPRMKILEKPRWPNQTSKNWQINSATGSRVLKKAGKNQMEMNQLIQSGDQGKIKILFHNNISSSYGTLGTVKTLFIGPGVGVFRKSFIHKNCSQNHGTGLV